MPVGDEWSIASSTTDPTPVHSTTTSGRGQASSSKALYLHDQDEIEIECDGPTALQVDGEDLGDAVSVRFEAERDALRVLLGDT